MWRNRILSIFLLTVGLSLFGCSAPQAAMPASSGAKEIKVGWIVPLTGGLAANGAQMQRGSQLAVDEINNAGGIKSLGGARLGLVFADHQNMPDVAARETQRLINDEQVVTTMGALSSATAVVVARESERLKTPSLITDGLADEITTSGYKYVFRIDNTADLVGRDYVNFVKWVGEKMNKPITKIATFVEDGAWGQSQDVAFRKWAASQGLQVTADVSFKTGSPDITPYLVKIKESGAEWILGAYYIQDNMLLLKTGANVGYNPYRSMTYGGGYQVPTLLDMGKPAEGVVGLSVWNGDMNKPGVKELAAKFQSRFGVPMDQNAAKAYVGMYIMADVLERAGSTDKDKIRDAFKATNLTSGPATLLTVDAVKFDANGQLPQQSLVMQVQGGKFVTVWPEKLSAAPIDTTPFK